MKHVEWMLIALAIAAAGCAGTLDDDFESFSGAEVPPARGDASASAKDSGAGWRDADSEEDAATEAPIDASARMDAAPAPDAGRTLTPDAAPVCDFRALVQSKCASASCHGAPASGSGLDLTSAGLAMRIEGRQSDGACSDKLLIDKEDPEQSALYLRVTGATCGVKMPLGGSLTASEQACVLTWIEGL